MPLSFWIKDLQERIALIQNWIDLRLPVIYWISGLFFPQAFFTGTAQSYAHSSHVAIDRCSFGFGVMDDRDAYQVQKANVPAPSGVYVYGVNLEGGRWDHQLHCLGPSEPKALYFKMWPMWLMLLVDLKLPEGCYECPHIQDPR